MKRKWILYAHITPSKKVYIGITSRTPEERWGNNGKKYLLKNKEGKYINAIFAPSIIKYGWENIRHLIVKENLSYPEAQKYEIKYIRYYKRLNRSLNVTDGGEGFKGGKFNHSEKSKHLIRLHHRRGNSLETREKIRNTLLGKKFNDIRKAHCKEGHRKEFIKVVQYDLEDNLIAIYESMSDAARATGLRSGNISLCCSGKYKTSGGFIWKIYENKD